MIRHATVIATTICLFLTACCTTREYAGITTDLLQGDTLDGWSHVLVDDAVKKEEVWRVEDGVLICKGEPLGYLHTDATYQNFRLTLEWRWAPGTEPGNSGVLLRIAGDAESFLPKCAEAQLQHGNAGDIWAFYGAQVEGDAARFEAIDHEAIGNFNGVRKIKAAEKAPGEWNRYEILVSESDMELRINGVLVNQATGLDVLSGPIGLQSEGGEIHFRAVRITEL